MSRRVGAAAAALAVSVALLLSACDGGEDPTDPPTETSSSASPTEDETTDEPSDVPTPPEVEAPTPAPEAATDDHVGAIHAARYFFDLYAYMLHTGESAQFEAMSATECEFCAGAVDTAVTLHEDGSWVEGGAIAFDIGEATAEYPTDEEPNFLVRFAAVEEAITIHHTDGSVETRGGDPFTAVVALQFVDGRFIAFGVNTE